MAETATQATESKTVAPVATTIATLGPSVRLIVFRFLTRKGFMPNVVPFVPIVRSPGTVRPDKKREGRQVLPPTSETWLYGLVNYLLVLGLDRPDHHNSTDYEYVGAGIVERRLDDKDDTRFTFCHRSYRNNSDLNPNFKNHYEELSAVLMKTVMDNLWLTSAYLNPYVVNDEQTDQSILMFDSNSRQEAIKQDGSPVMAYEDRREKSTVPGQIGKGIGSLVPLLKRANKLVLYPGNTIQIQRH